MKNNRETYKRVYINWGLIIIFGGINAWMIFAYIHQWGTKPIDEVWLAILSILLLPIYILFGRYKVIIDDNYAIFRTDVWITSKIPIFMIDKVSVKKSSLVGMKTFGSKFTQYQFDFVVKQDVIIQLINGKTYQIGIRNAEKIKEEIEKRMITTK